MISRQQSQHSALLLLLVGTLLCAPTLAWNPLKRRQNRPFQATTLETTTSPKVSSLDSRLYYQNGQEDVMDDLLMPSLFTTTAATTTTTVSADLAAAPSSILPPKPRPMDLPRHSPPQEVLQRQKFMLDAEMFVGRLAMVAAMVLFANEIFTGSSLADQVSKLFV
jgi:hypothetical protein